MAELILTKSTELKLYVLMQGLTKYNLWVKSGPWPISYSSKAKILFTCLKNFKGKRRGRRRSRRSTSGPQSLTYLLPGLLHKYVADLCACGFSYHENIYRNNIFWRSPCSSAEMNLTSNHEDSSSIPGLTPWVEDLPLL